MNNKNKRFGKDMSKFKVAKCRENIEQLQEPKLDFFHFSEVMFFTKEQTENLSIQVSNKGVK